MTGRIDRERLAVMVAAMVASPAQVFSFHAAYRPQLEGVVRRHLTSLERRDLVFDADEVDGLTIEVALELQERGGGWCPQGGALPWNWASPAIRSRIARYIGHARADVEVDHVVMKVVPVEGLAGSGEFDALADRDPVVGLLRDAIDTIAGVRDAEVHIEYQVQLASGDPSPAKTVATTTGLSASNVRQINHRVRNRLHDLVVREDRYASLRSLAWADLREVHVSVERVAA